MQHSKERFLRRIEAAVYVAETYGVPCSPKTLAKLATVGGGPLFCKAGRIVLYARGDLDGWIAGRLTARVGSTSALREVLAANPKGAIINAVGVIGTEAR